MALVNRRFRRDFFAQQPDLVLTIYGFNLSPESLALVRRQGVPLVCWWLNDPFQFQRSLKRAAHYDFVFSNCAASVKAYAAAGIKNAWHLPVGCAPAVHRVVGPEKDYACEVCFAGDWNPLRANALTDLVGKFDVKIFGPWRKHLPPDSPLLPALTDGFFTPEEMVRMFASTKVVLNLHSWHGKFSTGTNPRLFETAGCRAFQLVDWKQDIPDLFDLQTEIRSFQTLPELPAVIRAALADDAGRAQMAAAAQARAYREHTYVHRMQQLLAVLKQHA